MRIAIMGAGSLGTILGAYITKAGYQVDLIDAYKEHVDALNEKGAHVVGTVDFVQKLSLIHISVVAVTKTLIHIAATLGDKLCIITPNAYVERRTRQNAIRYGFRDFVATRTIEVSARDGIDAYSVYKETGEYSPLIEQFVEECIKAIEEDKAEVLSTGCGAIMWMSGIAQAELEKRGYQIPFINPTLAACEFAKALVNIGVVNPNYPEPVRKTGRAGCCI